MAGTGGISIALLHLNNECVGGETSPAFELLREKIFLNFTAVVIWAIHLTPLF